MDTQIKFYISQLQTLVIRYNLKDTMSLVVTKIQISKK